MIGQTISHYRIVEKLGEGGMGVVYRAVDTKLERDVALKFLAPHLLSDEEVRRRFEREAKAAAALDHLNICHVYEIDEAEGQSFIAMQLIEGESLDARIAQGPLKLVDALQIGEQIAQGLNAAHTKRVVHRDIKPQNVMIGADNRVEIMDFGLAHLADRSRITKANTSLGTVAYMSPEQAEGRQVDQRADIWALGCVLYEMVAGERPFLGEFDQAVLYSVLNEQPEPLTAIRTDVPVALEMLIDKCLAKKPEERYQSAAELAVDLRALTGKLASGTRIAMSRAGRSMPSPEPQPKPKRAWLPWALVGLLALAAAAAWMRPTPAPQREVVRLLVHPPENAVIKSFEVSPDGRMMAFVAQEEDTARLWLRRFDEVDSRPIAGTEGSDRFGAPFWSPDSRYIGFFADGKLKKVGVSGEPPIDLADAPRGRGGSWAADGSIIYSPSNNGQPSRVHLVSDRGGETTQVSFEEGANSHRSPSFLPDGKRFLVFVRHTQADRELMLGTVGEKELRPILKSQSHGVFYSSDPDESHGNLLVVQDRVLLAYPFDAQRGQIIGEPLPAVQDVGEDQAMQRGLFSAVGTVLAHATQNAPAPLSRLTWVDRQGRESETLGPIEDFWQVRISPDARWAATVSTASPGMSLNVLDLASGSRIQPAGRGADVWVLGWAPDSRRLFLERSGFGGQEHELLAVTVDGTAEPTVQRRSDQPIGSISADASWALLPTSTVGGISAVSLSDPESAPIVIVDEAFTVQQSRMSPDNAYVAYVSNETGEFAVHARSMPETASSHMLMGPGSRPAWRADGRELYYLSPQFDLMAVPVEISERGLVRGSPEVLFPIPLAGADMPSVVPYDPAADGKRFLVARPQNETIPTPVQVVLNWDVEFARLVAEREARR